MKGIIVALKTIVVIICIGVIAILLLFLGMSVVDSYHKSQLQNSNVKNVKTERVSHKRTSAPKPKVKGKIFTKHFYQGVSGAENDQMPNDTREAETKVTKGAKSYIDSMANRKDYLTYVSPAKTKTYNTNDGWGDQIEIAETTAVFVKRGNYSSPTAKLN